MIRIISLLGFVYALTACGAVSHQSKINEEYQPVQDLKVEILSVNNETGKDFGFDAELKIS